MAVHNEKVYLTIVHKAKDITVHNTKYEIKAGDLCRGKFDIVCTKLDLNMERVLLLNESGILKFDTTVTDSGLMEDSTVYVVETIRDQQHIRPLANRPERITLYIEWLDNSVVISALSNESIQHVKENVLMSIRLTVSIISYHTSASLISGASPVHIGNTD